jgi:hypothetical protein
MNKPSHRKIAQNTKVLQSKQITIVFNADIYTILGIYKC